MASPRYDPNTRAIRTSMRTFWTARGWRSGTKDTSGLPSPAEVQMAIADGIMFDAIQLGRDLVSYLGPFPAARRRRKRPRG